MPPYRLRDDSINVNKLIHLAETSRRFRLRLRPRMAFVSAALKVPRRFPPRLPDRINFEYRDFEIDLDKLDAATNGWMGPPLKGEAKMWTVDELTQEGFELEGWDGKTVILLRDVKFRVFGALAGRFDGEDDSGQTRRINRAFNDARCDGLEDGFLVREKDNRRGDFKAMVTGVSMGQGQQVPKRANVTRAEAETADRLLAHQDVKRLAAFHNVALSTYFPVVYERMHNYMSRLYQAEPNLKPNFSGKSVFPTCTFNVGPWTTTVNHLDHLNMVHGLCAITALGDYDPDQGGHLILFPLKRMIWFPPGSTILIPSSIIEHGNTPVVGGGIRMSMTQYFPAGIVRYIDYGFTTGTKLDKGGPLTQARKARVDGDSVSRLRKSIRGFSRSSRLKRHREKAFLKENPLPLPPTPSSDNN